jgi:hypothetical protein
MNIERFVLPPPDQIMNNMYFKLLQPYIAKYNIDVYELYSVLESFDKMPSEITFTDLQSRKKYIYIFKQIINLEYDIIVKNVNDPTVNQNIDNVNATKKVLLRILDLFLNEPIINAATNNIIQPINASVSSAYDNLKYFIFIAFCIGVIYMINYFYNT